MFHGALEDEILRRLVSATREPLYCAIFWSRQVDLLLASRDPMDQIVGELVDGAGNPMRLFEDDLVVLGNVRIEDGVRGSARERKDGLVVVTRKNEVVRAVAPFPDERQLHPVEVLCLVREDDRRVPGRGIDVPVARLDQIGEVEQTKCVLVRRPLLFELAQHDGPAVLRDHQAAHTAQLTKDLIAVLGQLGVVLRSGTFAFEPDLLLGRRDGQVRVVSIPLVYA